MTAITSHRPLRECSPEIARNQMMARASWDDVFSGIVYWGEKELTLDGEQVIFCPCEPFPRIKALAGCAATIPGWSALINADIIVAEHLKQVEGRLAGLRAQSAISRRYEFDPESNDSVYALVDLGLDFFAATQEQWNRVHREIPEVFRIGHQQWDTWMMGFFNSTGKCFDITATQCIFHPKHEDRKRVYAMETFYDKYISSGVFPPALR